MAIHNPPQYRYSLFEDWDKHAFSVIRTRAKIKNFPNILGDQEDKNKFLISLIRTQKSLHDWRDFLKDTLKQIEENNSIDTKSLNEKYSPESIDKDAPDWVTYEEDKIVNNFIDELGTKKVSFVGNDEEVAEFILRFIIGQLGHDWEQTVFMVWEMLGEENELTLSELNQEMRSFDYTKLFE